MERITNKQIESKIKTLNLLTGVSVDAYKPYRDNNGHLIQNKGHYYMKGMNGGFRLEQMAEAGANDMTPLGTKRELYNQVRAMIDALYSYKEINKLKVEEV